MSGSPEYYWLNTPSIIVDDSDPTIQYIGTWITPNETEVQSFQSLGYFHRTPMFNTLHVLQIFSASFSYNFTGRGISVFATPVDNTNYTLQCFLDGNQLLLENPGAQFGQSQPVCQVFGIPENMIHTISIAITVPPREQQQDEGVALSGFAFDYMLIQPLSGATPWDDGTQDLFLPLLDTEIAFNPEPTLNFGLSFIDNNEQIADVSRGWQFDPENGFHTTTPGSQFNVTFTGTCLWWYGYHQSEFDISKSPSSTLSIDGGLPSTFKPSGNLPSSQAFLFKTPVLQYASHMLAIVYHGSNETLPLTLQSVIVQKSVPTVLVPNSTVGLLPSTTMSKLPTSLTAKHEIPGGVVGGIVGGVIFLVFVVFGVCILTRWSRRRRRSMRKGPDSTTAAEPFPIPAEEAIGVVAPRKVQPGQQNISNPLMQQALQAPPLTKWTRRHTISGSPRPIPSSSTSTVQQDEIDELRISDPFIQSDSQIPLSTRTDVIDRQRAPQTGDPSHPTSASVVISTTPLVAHVGREEDSGLRMEFESLLPPVYTAH